MKTVIQGFHDLSFSDYQKLEAANKSLLDQFEKSPAHALAYLQSPTEPTDAMEFGSAAHCGVFEPEQLYKNFVACPEGMKRDERHAGYKEFLGQNPGKTVLKASDFQTLEAMMKAVRQHKVVSRLFSGGKAEMSAVVQDQEFGVLCKARPDYTSDQDYLIDFKTAESVLFRDFQKAVAARRYYVQAAWYLDVVNAALGSNRYKRFLLVAMEKKPPYGIMIYELDPEAITKGRLDARRNLKTYAECVKSGQWPGYTAAIQTMPVPEWV